MSPFVSVSYICLYLQLLRAIGFLNKHGFAHLDIKRENIVLEPIDHNDELTFNSLFLPLSSANQAVECGNPSANFDNIRVNLALYPFARGLSHQQVNLIDFGHAAHVLHFSRQIQQSDPNISSLDGHCPKGYSAPEAGMQIPGHIIPADRLMRFSFVLVCFIQPKILSRPGALISHMFYLQLTTTSLSRAMNPIYLVLAAASINLAADYIPSKVPKRNQMKRCNETCSKAF
jgi:serine/threonine protein kinase